MADASSVQWLTVTDFSGGIRQLTNADGLHQFSPQPVGTAAATDDAGVPVTFNCIALPGGGLGPLPFGFTGLWNGPGGAAGPPPDLGNVLTNYYVGGLHVPALPIMDTTGSAAPGIDNAVILVTLNYVYSLGPVHRYRAYRYNASINSVVEVNDNAGATPWHDTLGTNDLIHGGFTPMTDYRSSGAAAPTVPGNPYVIAGICDPGVLGTIVYQYPRPTFTNRMGNYVAIKQPIHLISHQGRLFVNGYDTAYAYSPTVDVVHNDDNYWTIPNQDTYDNAGVSSSLTQATVGSYGAISSTNASELIVIRATSHGGFTVSSDLNSPIITDYSGIQGTNGCYVDGCWTPLGFVYGTKEGSINVYVGGGRTQDLAPAMESGFWHEGLRNDIGQSLPCAVAGNIPPVVPHYGKFAYHNGFIFVPGNWIYDVNANTWWRFSYDTDAEGSQFGGRYFDTSPFGTVYCAPSSWATGHYLLYYSDFEQSINDTWQWTSQPIPIAKESEINAVVDFTLEGMAAVASGTGAHITVTITSYPNGQSYTIPVFAFAGEGSPEIFRHTINSDIRGTHVSVKILAENLDPNYAAPMVMRFDLGLANVSKVRVP